MPSLTDVVDLLHDWYPPDTAGSFDAVFAMNCLLHVPKAELPAVLAEIADSQVTSSFMVPAMLDSLAHQPGFDSADLSSLRAVMVGGSPLSDRTITTWADRGVLLMQGFGMTETTAFASVQPYLNSLDTGGSRDPTKHVHHTAAT